MDVLLSSVELGVNATTLWFTLALGVILMVLYNNLSSPVVERAGSSHILVHNFSIFSCPFTFSYSKKHPLNRLVDAKVVFLR